MPAPLVIARLAVDVATPRVLAIAAVVRPNSSIARKAIATLALLTTRRLLPERNPLSLIDRSRYSFSMMSPIVFPDRLTRDVVEGARILYPQLSSHFPEIFVIIAVSYHNLSNV
jgi:hypothetical protein